jgi:hypothetical protein
MGLTDQKILSCFTSVKIKFTGGILLDNSSYDEYSEV